MNRTASIEPLTSPSASHAEHLVTLFDDHDSMASGVAAFLRLGLEADDAVLMVSTACDAIAERLDASGVCVTSAIARGALHVFDAATTLRRVMRNDRPDAQLFEDVLGSRIAELIALGKRLWIYGDLADLLAAEGDFKAAQQLEELGSVLTSRHPVKLLCGYSAVSFGHPRTAPMLRAICAVHSSVRCNPVDSLGAFLIGATRAPSAGPSRTTARPPA